MRHLIVSILVWNEEWGCYKIVGLKPFFCYNVCLMVHLLCLFILRKFVMNTHLYIESNCYLFENGSYTLSWLIPNHSFLLLPNTASLAKNNHIVLDLIWLGIELTSWATLKQSVTFLKMTALFKHCQTLFNNIQLFPSWKFNIHSYQIEKQLFLILDAVRNPDRNHKLWNCESIEKKYFICRYCWNFATYTWKVHNGKIEINSFNEKFRS